MDLLKEIILLFLLVVVLVTSTVDHDHILGPNQQEMENKGKRDFGAVAFALGAGSAFIINRLQNKVNAKTLPVATLPLFRGPSVDQNLIQVSGKGGQGNAGQKPDDVTVLNACTQLILAQSGTSGGGGPVGAGAGGEPPTKRPRLEDKKVPDDALSFAVDDDDDEENQLNICFLDSSEEREIDVVVLLPEYKAHQKTGKYIAMARSKLPTAQVTHRQGFLASVAQVENALTQSLALEIDGTNRMTNFRRRQRLTLEFGLKGNTKNGKNSCNVDNFLTYVCLRQIRQPGFARRYFMMQSPAEKSLERIFKIYNEPGNIDQKSNRIKLEWSTNLDNKPGPYDLMGTEPDHIVTPLQNSTSSIEINICHCIDQADNQPRAR